MDEETDEVEFTITVRIMTCGDVDKDKLFLIELLHGNVEAMAFHDSYRELEVAYEGLLAGE